MGSPSQSYTDLTNGRARMDGNHFSCREKEFDMTIHLIDAADGHYSGHIVGFGAGKFPGQISEDTNMSWA